MSEFGTKRTSMGCQSMSAFGDKADNKCSGRAFPLLTLMRHPIRRNLNGLLPADFDSTYYFPDDRFGLAGSWLGHSWTRSP